MKLVIGLGNPGLKYCRTRHNIGFMVLDALAKHIDGSFKKSIRFNSDISECVYDGIAVILIKPLTYMNNSGVSAAKLSRHYRADTNDILTIYDDLDLELARLRFRATGTSGGHRGMESIIQHLETKAISRIKIGIGRNSCIGSADYVLQEFNASERVLIDQAIETAVKICIDWLKGKKIMKVS